MWVSGHQAGRASRWAYALGGLLGAGMIVAFAGRRIADAWWPAWVAAAVVFVGTIVLSRKFDEDLREQIRRGV